MPSPLGVPTAAVLIRDVCEASIFALVRSQTCEAFWEAPWGGEEHLQGFGCQVGMAAAALMDVVPSLAVL